MGIHEQPGQIGSVVLGGLFHPHLAVGYFRAAQCLLAANHQRADLTEVALPILFLMRHAIEVALKDLLLTYDDIETDQGRLDAHDGGPPKARPRPAREIEETTRTHDLKKLLDWVKAWMPDYVTPEWQDLVREVERHEQGAPDRFRYSAVRDNKSTKKKMVPSFPALTRIPVREIMVRVEQFMKQAADMADVEGADHSALYDLCLTADLIARDQYERGML